MQGYHWKGYSFHKDTDDECYGEISPSSLFSYQWLLKMVYNGITDFDGYYSEEMAKDLLIRKVEAYYRNKENTKTDKWEELKKYMNKFIEQEERVHQFRENALGEDSYGALVTDVEVSTLKNILKKMEELEK